MKIDMICFVLKQIHILEKSCLCCKGQKLLANQIVVCFIQLYHQNKSMK